MRICYFVLFHFLFLYEASSQPKINELEKAITIKDYRQSDKLSKELIASELQINQAYGYWGLGVSSLSSNPDSSNYYLQLALQKDPSDLLKIKVLNALGNYYDIVGLTKKSIQTFLKVVDLATEIDPSFLAGVYNNLCIGYRSLNQFDSSVYYGFQGLKIAEAEAMDFELKRLYNSIAISFAVQGDLVTAESFFRKSLAKALSNKDSIGASKSYINLTQIKVYQEDTDSAEYFLERAKVFNLANRNLLDILDMYSLLSELRISENKPSEAISYLDQALLVLGRANYPAEEISILMDKARAYLMLNNYAACQLSLDSAETLILKSDGKRDLLALRQLQKFALVQSNRLPEAIHLQDEIDSLEKVRFDSERAEAVEEIRIKYETDKKELQITELLQAAEISKLKNKQQLLVFAVIGVLLVSISLIGFFLFRNRNLKSVQEKLLMEKKLLRSQMNPHFLFNALASINAFIFKGDKYEASEYLNTFSELTRNVLLQSSKEWITLKEELKTVRQYLEIQSLRFNKLSFTIDCDADLEEVLVPPVLLQPFVENSIVHGFKDGSGGEIVINIEAEEQHIHISIEDSGSGFSQNVNPSSKAIEITRSRLNLLYGKNYGHNNPIIKNRPDANNNIMGVSVHLTLPIKESL